MNAKHQERYCLTAQFEACPIYQRQTVDRMPARVSAGRGFLARNRLLVLVVLLTMVFAGVVVGVVMLRQNPGFFGSPDTQAAGLQETPTVTPTPTRTATPTAVKTNTVIGGFRPFLPTTDLTRQACPKPTGWITYTVKPTDSLLRIAMVYGLTLEELLRANCLTEDTLVRSGERIYVPGWTPTPTPTVTRTPTARIFRPFLSPTATTDNYKPPTPIPPTPEPPTPIPPTDTPVPPTPPGATHKPK